MLAKLFGNISLAALVRALVVALISVVVALFLKPTGAGEFHLAAESFTVPAAAYIVAFILVVVICGLWLNNAFNDLEVLKGNYHVMPLFAWMVIPFACGASLDLLMCLPLVLLMLLRLISLAGTTRLDYVLFDTGVLTGIMVLLVPEAIVFILLAWLAILVFRTLFFRALLMPVVGLVAIWFMIFTVMYFISGNSLFVLLNDLLDELQWHFALPDLSINPWALIPLGLVLLPAGLELLQLYAKANVFKKQVFNFLIFFVLLVFVASFFVKNSVYLISWLCLPLSIWVANLVIYTKKGWRKDLVYAGVFLFWLISFF